MDLIAGMEGLGTSGIPLLAAFFIGLLMTFSPCPLATNVTAIAYISRKIGNARHTLLVGTLYSLGRMAAYIGLAVLIVYSGLNIQAISFFLQEYGEKLLGVFLIIMGILMLEIIDLPIPGGHRWLTGIETSLADRGYAGGFILGVIFALALCPFSAVLFFGMLIPLALKTGDALIIPAVFGIATALPVIIISFLITHGIKRVSGMMTTVQKIDIWVKRAVAVVFIGIGIYYIMIVYGPMTGIIQG